MLCYPTLDAVLWLSIATVMLVYFTNSERFTRVFRNLKHGDHTWNRKY